MGELLLLHHIQASSSFFFTPSISGGEQWTHGHEPRGAREPQRPWKNKGGHQQPKSKDPGNERPWKHGRTLATIEQRTREPNNHENTGWHRQLEPWPTETRGTNNHEPLTMHERPVLPALCSISSTLLPQHRSYLKNKHACTHPAHNYTHCIDTHPYYDHFSCLRAGRVYLENEPSIHLIA